MITTREEAPFIKRNVISLIIGFISTTFSISSAFPRTFLVYLLTADWEIPSRVAISSCFNPLLESSLEIKALRAGKRALVATSHGRIIYGSP
jgi:hypothetical protein